MKNIATLFPVKTATTAPALLKTIVERQKNTEVLPFPRQGNEAFADSINVVVWEADARTFQRTFISRQVQELLGYRVEEWLSDPTFWQDRLHAEDREWVIQYCTEAILECRDHEVEYRMISADGRIVWVRDLVWISPENGTAGMLQGLSEDITERKEAEERLRQTDGQLDQVLRTEVARRLTGGVAIDFNNLLTVINGYSELILARMDQSDPLRKDILAIQKAGERAVALTHQLLAFSCRHAQPKILNLNSVIWAMEKMLRRLVGDRIVLVLNLEMRPGRIKADPGQIELMILGLALHARNSMPDGGVIIVETSSAIVDETSAGRNPVARPGAYVVLSMLDSGCGLDEDTRLDLLGSSAAAKDKSKGSGPDLGDSCRIARQSGGYIEVASEPSRGATYKVYLPMVRGEKRMLNEISGEKASFGRTLSWRRTRN